MRDISNCYSWDFCIDRGGTFTDIVAHGPDGEERTLKLLSDNPEHYEDAALEGIRRVLGVPTAAPIPARRVGSVKMGTTVATNALLEKQGDRTVLLVTRGFADVLRIGYQNRPDIFARRIELPQMLYARVIEVDERIAADGSVRREPDLDSATRALQSAFDEGVRSCAIAFLHACRNGVHEKAVGEIARRIGFTCVRLSHEVSAQTRYVNRADTTVVDAYLSPVLRRYVDRVAGALGDARVLFMKSNGGLTEAGRFFGRDAVLSGPAGGVVACVRTATRAGFERVIGFDMGGTSTDVCHFAGELEQSFDTTVAGARLCTPMMHIHTVAAGGGSVLHFDGNACQVGPDSAGANPGPACYRRGGPLTVTDCNVMLGRIQAHHFPAVFGDSGDQPLDTDIVRDRFEALAAHIGEATGVKHCAEQVAEGFLTVAVDAMASAIRKVSVQRGYDVSTYVMNCFGGAGGQHACRVADQLGMTRVLIHPHAGVLSAYGMGLAEIVSTRDMAVDRRLDQALLDDIEDAIAALEREALEETAAQGPARADITLRRQALVKYRDTDVALPVELTNAQSVRHSFEDDYRRQFGFIGDGNELVLESVLVTATGAAGGDRADATGGGTVSARAANAASEAEMYVDGEWRNVPVHDREILDPGAVVHGPSIVREPVATVIVESGWTATVLAGRELLLERTHTLATREDIDTGVDPVRLELFNNLFMSIAEEMGVVLQRTARSANIRERLDFSCAVFDGDGGLVANAPHMPVHLGSMGETVRLLIDQHGDTIAPGDVFLQNNPYRGGTHLPDLTVVSPVFDDEGIEPLFFVASRAHHADIGGTTPGSMPPDSRHIDEEGVLLDNVRLVEGGRFREEAIRALLSSGPWPARNIEQNLADLKAQAAANARGIRGLSEAIRQYGLDAVQAYMKHGQDHAEEQVRRAIHRLRDGHCRVPMDDDSEIRVAISVNHDERSAVVDFTGTSAQRPSNFNAPFAITRAAVLYVFRTLVDGRMPMNEGCARALRIIVPEGSMLRPVHPAAVVAGNVEVSQAIVDALYGALGNLAASQGTMNNFTFGNTRYQHYETICGGAGAGEGFDGADAVHTHMTNSRLTDPEVLESRFPVELEAFAIRRGSGGDGRWRGGDGVVRRVRFLEPMTASLLANRHRAAPFGLAGGNDGRRGRAWVERRDGTRVPVVGTGTIEVDAGDAFVLETPGGGGFGDPDNRARVAR